MYAKSREPANSGPHEERSNDNNRLKVFGYCPGRSRFAIVRPAFILVVVVVIIGAAVKFARRNKR